jgi:hypothetical protein
MASVNAWDVMAAVVEQAPKAPNLWGALGCAMAFAAALFTALDAFADMLLARVGNAAGFGPAHGLKFGGKLAASGLTVTSAGLVLALDSNWFALIALSAVFIVVIVVALVIMRRGAQRAGSQAGSVGVA